MDPVAHSLISCTCPARRAGTSRTIEQGWIKERDIEMWQLSAHSSTTQSVKATYGAYILVFCKAALSWCNVAAHLHHLSMICIVPDTLYIVEKATQIIFTSRQSPVSQQNWENDHPWCSSTSTCTHLAFTTDQPSRWKQSQRTCPREWWKYTESTMQQ